MNTYFVKGTYDTLAGFKCDFGIVFDVRPITAENIKRQIRLELGITKNQNLNIHNIVKL